MSEQTVKAIKDAIQAHIDDKAKPGEPQQFLLEVAIGYGTMKVREDGGEMYVYGYITDPHATPHSSVGLFAMAASQLDMDLDPNIAKDS